MKSRQLNVCPIPMSEPPQGLPSAYALMTAVRNEEATIEQTIHSVVAQTMRPHRWVIVSDNSTDGTDEIISRYTARYDFMALVHIEHPGARSFASKGRALQAAMARLNDDRFEYIGNLDGDVVIGPSFFESLIRRFKTNPQLGLAGGLVCEEQNGQFRGRRENNEGSVAHAAQLISRECYLQIGGYTALEFGGEDWLAQTKAKMKGWRTYAFPDLQILHLRPPRGSLVRRLVRQGRMDYSLGSDPFFEILKCLRRSRQGGLVRLSSFLLSCLRREERPVSKQFVEFLQNEQRQRVRSFLGFGHGTGRNGSM